MHHGSSHNDNLSDSMDPLTTSKTVKDPRATKLVEGIVAQIRSSFEVSDQLVDKWIDGECVDDIDEELADMESEEYGRVMTLGELHGMIIAAFKEDATQPPMQ